jgi:hypothetical protein
LLASRVIRVVGILLLVVAAIHLAVTPLLKKAVLDRVLTQTMVPIVTPPFLLNHIVVGILLVPLGFVTLYSAAGIRAGERWAWVVSWSVGASLTSLPVALVLIMRGGPFDAVPFRVAEILITICAVTMPAVLIWARAEFSRRGKPAAQTGLSPGNRAG